MNPLPPIRDVLPHREPFLFLDRVLELGEGHVVGARVFRADEPFFAGHFPGHPVVPGVVLVEGLAQTMAYFALVQRSAPQVFLVGIDRARFRGMVLPGSEVIFQVRVQGDQRFGMLLGSGEVLLDGKCVADAALRGYAGEPGRAFG